MKLFFIICLVWVPNFIKGVPNDHEQWLQPRALTDLPFISWFYDSETEDNHEENYAPNLPQQSTDELSPERLQSKKNDITNQYVVNVDPIDQARLNDEPKSIETFLKKLEEEMSNPGEWKSEESDANQIRVIPVDKAGPNDKPEPIENLLENLKQEVSEASEKEKTNTMALLTDLSKTMRQTSANLTKVFINKAWRIFDIGILGTTRRTRNVKQAASILAPLYALFGYFNQWFDKFKSDGSSLLHSAHGGNNIQGGNLFEQLFPSYSNNSPAESSIDQKIVGGIVGLPGIQEHDSQKVPFVCIDDNTNKNADHLIRCKTPDEILSKIKILLDKDKLDTEEKFYIIMKLHDMFDRFSKKNDDTVLKIIKSIFLVGEDPRFEQLFNIFKSKKESEFDDLWELFKQKRKLNEKFIKIIRNLPGEKIKEHPSRDCIIIGPENESIKDSDDNKSTQSISKNIVDFATYLMELAKKVFMSKKDYHICCIDDDDELKANHILDGKTNDETIDKIKIKMGKDDLSTEYKWYIILKLYKMLTNIEKYDKNDEKDKKDKNEIINLITLIGENSKFEPLLKKIKEKNDPRFLEIWKLLKNEPREPKEKSKPPIKDDNDYKIVEKNLSQIIKRSKSEKDNKHEKEPKKKTSTVAQTTSPPPDWRYDPILNEIEIRLKDPYTDEETRWKVIRSLDTLYLNADFPNRRVKSRVERIIKMIKQDSRYNEIFDIIKRDNSPEVTRRVFNIFGKKYLDPSDPRNRFAIYFKDSNLVEHENSLPSNFTHSTRSFNPYNTEYYWLDRFHPPKDDYVSAKLPLTDKVDILINLYTMSYAPYLTQRIDIGPEVDRIKLKEHVMKIIKENNADFDNFENVFIPQIQGGNEFLIRMLGEFKDYLLKTDDFAKGTTYQNIQERKKMQDFIDEQKRKGVITK